MQSAFTFSNQINQVSGFTFVFLGDDFAEGKLDGVAGLEPANDRIKIYCLTNLAIPQHRNDLSSSIEIQMK